MDRYKWALNYADKLDELDATRETLSAELSAREFGDLFARWGAGVRRLLTGTVALAPQRRATRSRRV